MGYSTDSLLSSRWLTGADVEPFKDWTVEAVTQEEVGRDKEVKTIMWFAESDKGLVCNRTNTRNLIAILGKGDTDNWKGKQVQLYATLQEFGGEEYNVVRVRPVQPAGRRSTGNGGKPVASNHPTARQALDAFMSKNKLDTDGLVKLVKDTLHSDTIAVWVKAESDRTAANAITKLQEAIDLESLEF